MAEVEIPVPATSACCESGTDCGCGPSRGLSRRGFLGLGAGALLAAGVAGPAIAVPADKRLDPRWVRAILARGGVTGFSGDALTRIGMPVGGVATGQVYLSGDGRLWLWDVLNDDAAFYGGADFAGVHYADPLALTSAFTTGTALRATTDGHTQTVHLDGDAFPDTTFEGRYPIGSVALRGGDVPVEVDLDVFTPFVPTVLADSELPTTVLEYTVRNTGRATTRYELLALAENPVCLRARSQQPIVLGAASVRPGGGDGVQFSAAPAPVDDPTGDDIVFEDWSGAGYGAWTTTGTAFGAGPVAESELPPEMLRFGGLGSAAGRFVTSYAFRAGGSADDATGTLRSPDFEIARDAILTRVGGGHGDALQVRVVVDGEVVASATGLRYEPLRPVYLDVSAHRGHTAHIEIVDGATGPWGHLNVDRFVFTDRPAPRPDVVVEDWSSNSFANWTVQGTAFGSGPVTEAATPDYFRREGPLDLLDTYFATSHDYRAHPGDAGAADTETGTLTGRDFTIDRRYLVANIGGGSDTALVGLRVVVDGEVVARLAGNNSETLAVKAVDLHTWQGRTAHLEIVDNATGGWGHTNVDRIWFSDLPIRVLPPGDLRDNGTFGVAAFGGHVRVRPSIASWATVDDWFDAPAADAHTGADRQAGTVSVRFSLRPGQHRTVRLAYAWNFPRVSLAKFGFLEGAADLRHHYATRFPDARSVLDVVGRRGRELSQTTHEFVDTWYRDTTLPNWFVERTFAPASTVATETCQYFDNGRFYAWEGAYCCAGTCTHVWNYAQSVAYLFPELERSARTMADYDIGFHPDTGAIDYRGEADRRVAHDGQCGNILRTYREHQMSTSTDFLKPIWPQVKKATQYLIGHDGSPANGIFETDQYNTLDATWFGEIPWISGLYVAALHAAAEMALDMGDDGFARQCRAIAALGSDYLDEKLWNAKYEYFEQHLDPDHLDATNSNRGCYLDQMFGQTWTHQLALSPVFARTKADTALHSIYRNNFLPDARAYMGESGIEGGREFTTDGEAGTLMCTWPFGGADEAPGAGAPSSVAYFNEVWTGTEWQFAAHLLHAGHVEEGMAVARAIYDRYSTGKRNPYNEIECSDHYARAMMAHGTYLAALGFEHHGPRGHLGFAPKIGPDDFRAAFTVGAGWGTYTQQRRDGTFKADVHLRFGRLARLRSFAVEVAGPVRRVDAVLLSGGRRRDVRVRSWRQDGNRLRLTFASPVDLEAGRRLQVHAR